MRTHYQQVGPASPQRVLPLCVSETIWYQGYPLGSHRRGGKPRGSTLRARAGRGRSRPRERPPPAAATFSGCSAVLETRSWCAHSWPQVADQQGVSVRYATAPERFAHLLGTLHARVVAAGGGTGRRVRQADPDTLEMIGIAAAGGVLAAGTRVETAGGVAADPTVRTGSGGRLFHRVPAERESRFQPAVRTARSESAASRSSARELSPILRS